MISKRQASQQNDRIYADQLAAAEKFIDRALASRYASGRSVSIDIKEIPLKDRHLRDKLLSRYKKAGWSVKHETGDQRDWYENYVFS
jgi:hypothetical protein